MAVISQQDGCMSAGDGGERSVQAALDAVFAAISPLTATETVAIKGALKRTLAEDIVSSIAVPSAINSAMDGYAVHGNDIPVTGTAQLAVVGAAFAGTPHRGATECGQAVRIMTGAMMPGTTDTVIPQERVEVAGDTIVIGGETRAGDNVRQAGEDIARGAVVLTRGTAIQAADLGLIASLGIAQVQVIRRPVVAFFSTGDELCSIGQPLEDGKIYDSNRYTLFGMLSALNVEIVDMGVVRDRRDRLQRAFSEAAEQADLIITTGGVSVGEADLVKEVLQKTGTVDFWKVAIKPGRPLAFGNIHGTYFFGLPGNPVSVMVTFHQFVKPALKRLAGETPGEVFTATVRCVSKLRKKTGRVEYQRGVLERDTEHGWQVRKTGAQGSGILRSMSEANCLIVLPAESATVEPGSLVEVQLFEA